MAIDETMLRRAITDVLLSSAGLPTLAEAKKLLSKIKERVEVIVEERSGSKVSEQVLSHLRSLLGDAEKVKLLPVRVKEWTVERPDPLILIGGRLGGRYRFYGDPAEILEPMFLLAVAAAGGAWEPKTCKGLETAKGTLVLYVVPGLPCAKAMYHTLPVVLCSKEAVLEVVNIETWILEGGRPPVNRVPAFLTPRGRLHMGAPRGPGDAVKLWQG